MKKSLTKKIIVFALAAALLAFCGCSDMLQEQEKNKLPISPVGDASQSSSVKLQLLFKHSENILSGETREVSAAADEQIEASIVRALIAGPSDDHYQLGTTINHDTKVVDVKKESQYLAVTLSKEFLEPLPNIPVSWKVSQIWKQEKMLSQKLAVYSIVNTLILYGSAKKVLILVDKDDSGKGQRVTRGEMGFDDGSANVMLEPLAFDTDMMMTPKRVVQLFFAAVQNKDWKKAYALVASKDLSGKETANADAMVEQLNNAGLILFDSAVSDASVSSDGQTALVVADYKEQQGVSLNINEVKSVPVQLRQEQEVWKISYESFRMLMKME